MAVTRSKLKTTSHCISSSDYLFNNDIDYKSQESELRENKVNDGLFTWRWNNKKFLRERIFDGKELNQHKQLKENKQLRLQSGLFKIGGFEWKLEAFPKGEGNTTSNSFKDKIFNLYLVLPKNKNKHLDNKSVTINLRLYNYESGASWTGNNHIQYIFNNNNYIIKYIIKILYDSVFGLKRQKKEKRKIGNVTILDGVIKRYICLILNVLNQNM